MKILAFADLHGRINLLDELRKKVKEADIIISAGDLTNFENDMRTIIAEIDSWGKTVFMINGNHEDDVNMERACKNMKNTIFLHKKSYRTDKYIFLGFGGGGFVQQEPEFDKVSKDFAEQIRDDDRVVLVTHGPPQGTMLDIIGDDHVGCYSYKKFIDRNKVHVYICGHLHENQKVSQNYNNRTIILNPGPRGLIVEV